MARPFILLTPADGGLWRLAKAVARQNPMAVHPTDFAGLVRRLCQEEGGRAEVNIAQMSEILSVVQGLLAADPKAVLEVLASKIGE